LDLFEQNALINSFLLPNVGLKKLSEYKDYFNNHRVHFAHSGKTPGSIAGENKLDKIDIKNYRWKKVCNGMYEIPIAA